MLCLFPTFLAKQIQHSSIKVYLSRFRAFHIEQGHADPLANCLCLQRVVHGLSASSRLPITDDLMLVIWWYLDVCLPAHLMFWAACSLGYFGFLCTSEFMVPSLASFSPSLHLGVQEIAVDFPSAPSCMCLHIKGSKTDQFTKGAFIHIGLGCPPPPRVVHSADISREQEQCSRSLVSIPEWAASFTCFAHRMASADPGVCKHSRQLLQPKLPHQGCHCGGTKWGS